MKKLIKYLVVFVAVALAAHLLTVWLFPDTLMSLVQARVLEQGGMEPNQLYHKGPNTAENDVVVMSCPDLLYSFAVYDLSAGPLRLRMPPVDTYWSAALYSGDTTNYLTVNDTDMGGGPLDMVIAGPDYTGSAPRGAMLVRAPGNRGLIMLRTLITHKDKPEPFVATQRRATLEHLKE